MHTCLKLCIPLYENTYFYGKTRFCSGRRLLSPLRLRSTETSCMHTNDRRELQPRSMSRAPGLHSRDLLYIPKWWHFNFLSPGRTVETHIYFNEHRHYGDSLSSMQKRQPDPRTAKGSEWSEAIHIAATPPWDDKSYPILLCYNW